MAQSPKHSKAQTGRTPTLKSSQVPALLRLQVFSICYLGTFWTPLFKVNQHVFGPGTGRVQGVRGIRGMSVVSCGRTLRWSPSSNLYNPRKLHQLQVHLINATATTHSQGDPNPFRARRPTDVPLILPRRAPESPHQGPQPLTVSALPPEAPGSTWPIVSVQKALTPTG